MEQQQQQGQRTGTRNETYDLISVLYHALQGAENCQIYLNDAHDGEARDFFQQALQQQRQLADKGKQVLQKCLQKDTGGQSAFGWSSTGGQSSSSNQSTGSSQNAMGSSQQNAAETAGARSS